METITDQEISIQIESQIKALGTGRSRAMVEAILDARKADGQITEYLYTVVEDKHYDLASVLGNDGEWRHLSI